MTQLPYPDIRSSGNTADAQLADSLSFFDSTTPDPFKDVFLNEEGRATFQRPTSNFFQVIGNKLFRDQAASDDFTLLQKFASRSGAEAIASMNEEELMAPIAEVEGVLVLADKQIPLEQATARDAFSTLPGPEQMALERMGITADSLTYMGINTAEDLKEKWSTVVHLQRANQLIQDFNDRSSGFTRFRNTAATVSVNIITDPTVLLTAGYGAYAKAALRSATQQAIKQTSVRATVDTAFRDGVFPAVFRGSLIGEKVTAARVLNALAYGTANATITSTLLAGEQVSGVEAGILSPEDGYNFSPSMALLTGSLAALFGDFAFRSAGLRAKPMTRSTYRAMTGDDDFGLVSHLMGAQERLNRRSPEEVFQNVDIESVEAVEDAAKYLYDSVQLREISDRLADDDVVSSVNYGNMFNYLDKKPNFEELIDYMDNRGWESPTPPDTEYSKIIDGINIAEAEFRELSATGKTKESREYKDVLDALKKRKNELDTDTFNRTRRSDLFSEFREREQGSVPINSLSPTEQASRIAQIIGRVSTKANRTRPGRLIPGLRKTVLKTNNVLDDLTAAKVGIHYGSTLESDISRLQTLLDHNKHSPDELFVDSNGEMIRSTYDLDHEFRNRRALPLTFAVEDYTKKMSDAEIYDLGLRVARARNSGDLSGLTPEEVKIHDLAANLYDEVGERAVRGGVLDNRLPNYTHIVIQKHATPEQQEIFQRSFADRVRKGFDPTKAESPINYNALAEMGLVNYNGKKVTLKGNGLEAVPERVGDLPDDIRADYEVAFEESIELDAEAAFVRRMNRHEELLDDPDISASSVDRRQSPNTAAMRRIEQDFYLSDEMADSGLVNYDVVDSANKYISGTGYNLFRAEPINQLFGEIINPKALLEGMYQASANDPKAKAAVERYRRVDKRNSGRIRINDSFAVPATAMQDIAAAGVANTIGQTIIQTEVAGGVLRVAGGAKNVQTMVAQFVEALSSLDKRTAKELMTLMENESNRFVGASAHYLDDDLRNNTVLKATGTINRISRIASLERFFTTMAKNFNFMATYGKPHRYANKLDRISSVAEKMAGMGNDIPDKTLRGLAREAGIPAGDLTLMRINGLTTPESLGTMRKMLAIDKDGMRTPSRFVATLQQLPTPEERAAARQLESKMRRMAAQDASTFVATPTANTEMTTEHSLTSMLLGFTTFQRSFAGGAVSRASLAPAWKQIAGLGFLVGATTTTRIARQLLYNGESPETIMDKWNEDPVREMALILGELPLLGPFNMVPPILMGAGLGSRYGLENLTDAPAIGIIGRQTDAVRLLWKSIREGEETPASVLRTVERTVPGPSLWYARLLDEMTEGFQEDSDR